MADIVSPPFEFDTIPVGNSPVHYAVECAEPADQGTNNIGEGDNDMFNFSDVPFGS